MEGSQMKMIRFKSLFFVALVISVIFASYYVSTRENPKQIEEKLAPIVQKIMKSYELP